MTHSERIDACIAQAELATKLFDTRRNYEWKVSLSFWAAIIASATVLRVETVPLYAVVIIDLVVASLHGFWLWHLTAANYNDNKWSLHYRKLAQAILIYHDYKIAGAPKKVPAQKLGWYIITNWAVQFQFGVTVVLLSLVSAFLIIYSPAGPPTIRTPW